MAGNPKFRALAELIEILGGEDYVMMRLLELGNYTAVANELGVTPALFHFWVQRDDDRRLRMVAVRELVGLGMVDHILELADEVPDINPLTGSIDSAWVSNQKNRIEARKWVAGRHNASLRDNGQRTEVQVNVQNVVADLMSLIRERNQRLVGGTQRTIEGEVVPTFISKPLVSPQEPE